MLDIFITLVVIAHVVVSLLLILVILMQRPKQEGLGAAFGAGMTDAAFGAKTTDVLQKGTVYLGTLFFIFSLVLAILMGKRNAIEGKNYASDGGSSASAPVETTEAENSVLGNAGNVVAPVPAEAIAPPAEAIDPRKQLQPLRKQLHLLQKRTRPRRTPKRRQLMAPTLQLRRTRCQ